MNLTIARLDLRLRRRAMIGYAIGLAAYAFAIVALYPSFKNDAALDRLTESNSTMMAAFGVSGSLTSPVGWLNANLFNNFLPLIVIILTVGYGAWCVAGQDEDGTLALTATLPVTRLAIIGHKTLALVVQALPAVLLTFLCVLAGRAFQLPVDLGALTAVSVGTLLLAVDFGALALLLGTVTGSRGLALSIASAAAAAAYLISSLAPVISWLGPVKHLSPFYWALGGDPLANGLSVGSGLALVGTAVGLVVASVLVFRRFDVH
jgi:ABC-2 type transport system permease protein